MDIVVVKFGNSNTNPVQLGSAAVQLSNNDGTIQQTIQYTPQVNSGVAH